jgi:hypothetical protein
MKTIICDICKATISISDQMTRGNDPDIRAVIGKPLDICHRCRSIGASLDPAQILLEAWKNRAKQDLAG